MAETLGAASELDAVNELLASIGEDPVIDIEDLPPSGNTALTILRATSRAVQEEPHWFNKEPARLLTPDVDGIIAIPDSFIEVDSVEGDMIVKDGKLYDQENETFVHTAAVECFVLHHRLWAELPSIARRYITALAIERFIESFPGAEATSQSRQRNLLRATHAFKRAELRHSDYNLLTGSSSIQTLLRR